MGNYLSGYFGGLYISRAESDWDLHRSGRGQASTMSDRQDQTSQSSDRLVRPGSSDHADREKTTKRASSTDEQKDNQKIQPKIQKCETTSTEGVKSSKVTTRFEGCQHQAACSDRCNSCLDFQENLQEKSEKSKRNVEISKFVTSRKCSKVSIRDGCDAVFTGEGDRPQSDTDNESITIADSSDLHINELPNLLLVQIFLNLPVTDLLCKVCLVSKYWYDIGHDPALWRVINLRGQMKVTNDVLQLLTSYSGSVTSIDLSDARSVTDDGIVTMAKQCTGVRDLKLVRCIQLKEEAFMSLGLHCPMIVSLYLDCCFSLSNKALEMIASGCPKLTVLHINQCSRISDQGIEAVGNSCPCLEDLSMDQCKQVGDEGLGRLVEGCPKLRKISAMSCVFTSFGITKLTKIVHLERLELHDVLGVNDECIMEVVSNCRELQTLNVALCTQITDRGLDVIAKRAKNLKAIYLASCDITDKALVSLGAHCRKLESVDVGWCSQITDAGAVALSETCPSLRSLGLIKCDKVTIQTMDQLVQRFPNVHYSTFWLDCRRLMEKAKRMGYTPAAQFAGAGPLSAVVPSSSS